MTAPPATAHDLAPGTVFGSYRINRLLGRGGMGAVYEAQHTADGRIVALKLLSVDLDKMDARERFLREGRIAASINHPNAVYIYGTEEIEGAPTITMELVPGGTLEDKVHERGPLAVAESITDILQVIDGLDAALAAGVLHRDVKPSNCFIGTNGIVKIGDFGLSKPVDGDEQNKLTKTGLFLGTPVYSSPEQLLGETLDVRSDIYAVGVSWYYLLTGELPYQSGSMMQVVAAVLNGAPAPLATKRPDIPDTVAAVVAKAMARKADDRYQSYAELREAVAALVPRETVAATVWDRGRAWVVDTAVLYLASSALGLGLHMAGVASDAESAGQRWMMLFASLAFALLVQGIPEGLRGMTLGKWLVGIRVVTPTGAVPGLLRAAARAGVVWSTDLVGLIARLQTGTGSTAAAVESLATIIGWALLFVTVRRGQGLVMLQDKVTGTRVVRPLGTVSHRTTNTVRAEAPALTGQETRIGPYAVLGPIAPDSTVLRAWDDSMRRSVWIVPRAPGTPETSQARRSVARLTRLRWVAGRRSAEENWDAFEAPVGEPLGARLSRPVTWTDQQEWSLDLASELVAGAADGTLAEFPAVEALWITRTNRVVIPEATTAAQAPSATAPAAPRHDSSRGAAFIKEFLQCTERAQQGAPRPRHAAVAMASVLRAGNVQEIQQAVTTTLGRPVVVSQLRRLGLMAATLGPLVACPVTGAINVQRQAERDPVGWKLSGLAEFLSDSIKYPADSSKPSADSAATRTSGTRPASPSTTFSIGRSLGRTTRMLGVANLYADQYRPPREIRRREEHLAEVYIASALLGRKQDTTSMWPSSKSERATAAAIVARNPVIDSAALRAARQLVDSTWQGRAPATNVALLPLLMPAIITLTSAVFFACISLVLVLIMRRGPLLHYFQLDVVTRHGRTAGRLRMLLRTILVWAPIVLPALFLLCASLLPVVVARPLAVALFVLLPLCWIYGIVSALRTPERGLADRLAGTWLVPE